MKNEKYCINCNRKIIKPESCSRKDWKNRKFCSKNVITDMLGKSKFVQFVKENSEFTSTEKLNIVQYPVLIVQDQTGVAK